MDILEDPEDPSLDRDMTIDTLKQLDEATKGNYMKNETVIRDNNLYDLLANADVLNRIHGQDRVRLAELAVHHQLDTGEFLTYQGDHWPELLLIGSGALKWVLLSESGREHVFFILESGAIFWGHTLFDDQPMPASLVTQKPSKVYTWNREIIKPIFSRHPEVMWEIGKNLVGIMRRNREVVINLAFRQVAGRLAKILLDISNPADKEIERDFTLDEFAAMTATSPEVICRVLYNLQDQEVLEITRARIMIHDHRALQGLVEKA